MLKPVPTKSRGFSFARPTPPEELYYRIDLGTFSPSPEMSDWISRSFLNEGSPLVNTEHHHLRFAQIGVLWTNAECVSRGRRVLGTAEMCSRSSATTWVGARHQRQIIDWFGYVPDFIMTLDAVCALQCSDAQFCALVEHELYHMGQDRDGFGFPKFRKDGRPAFTIRPHDIEEFVGVVRRYGAGAAGVQPMIDAASFGPEVTEGSIAAVCGTCAPPRRAA